MPLARFAGVQRVLPPGTLPVGTGLVANGVAAYGFLVISARALGPQSYSALAALWALTYLLTFGFFVPLEREVARALAARGAMEAGARLVRRAALMGAFVLAVLLVASLAAGAGLLDRVFDGQVLLLASLALALSGYLIVHLARGVLSGTQQLGSYGMLLGAEGAIRLLLCLLLVLVGVRRAGAYGLVFAAAPLAALAVTTRPSHFALPAGPTVPWAAMSTRLGHLIAATVLSQVLLNGPAVAVRLLAREGEEVVAGRFMAGLAAARIPLFLFVAVEVALLPKLTSLVADGNIPRFRSDIVRLIVFVVAMGVCAVLGAYAVGSPLVRFFFGSEFALGRADLTVLAGANAAFILAMTCTDALLALTSHGRITLGWAVGVAGFLAMTAVPAGLVPRVGLAYLVGCVMAAVTMGALVVARLRDARGIAAEEVSPVVEVPSP